MGNKHLKNNNVSNRKVTKKKRTEINPYREGKNKCFFFFKKKMVIRHGNKINYKNHNEKEMKTNYEKIKQASPVQINQLWQST